MIRFACSNCNSGIEASSEDAGYRVKCPTCQLSVIVPVQPVTTVEKPGRLRWDLVTIGTLLGILILIGGIASLFSSPGHQNAEDVVAELVSLLYGGALCGLGASILLSERNQPRETTAIDDDKAKIQKKLTVIFVVLCLVYGWLAGVIPARGLLWRIVGSMAGGLGGAVGASYCLVVLENQAISLARRVHACIFISLLTLGVCVLVSAFVWDTLGPFGVLLLLLVLLWRLIMGPHKQARNR